MISKKPMISGAIPLTPAHFKMPGDSLPLQNFGAKMVFSAILTKNPHFRSGAILCFCGGFKSQVECFQVIIDKRLFCLGRNGPLHIFHRDGQNIRLYDRP